MSSAIYSLIGVVIGGLISSISQYIISLMGAKEKRRSERKESYISVLNEIHLVIKKTEDFAGSVSGLGIIEPLTEEKDKESAEKVGALFLKIEKLNQESLLVSLLGSDGVSDEIKHFVNILDTWLRGLLVEETQMFFKAEVYQQVIENMRKKEKKIMRLMRTDL
ncbi:hypothetical protein [Lactococcus cremoris]|uniref:hypothetical protein n=1 Tax=Lactococcus lactis subsp. cremoris TaxID=1359 RepID=UPI0003ABC258|nr:hypothetical protein [Lactococcus cremoris]AGV72847.1 hypothetical protein kw2_0889 [Lactococcus cremoris subsp. cremoris KW2]